MKTRSIHVLGGARGIGRWFAEHVFAHACRRVCLYDVTPLTTPINVQGVSFEQISYSADSIHGLPDMGPDDAVVLSVPVHEIQRTTEALFKLLPDNTLVVDMSSVKVKTHAILDKTSAGRLAVMGIHPLFGPQVPSPIGQTTALTGFDASHPTKRSFRDMLTSAGLLIAEITPHDHDSAMLYIQALTHFTYLTFAQVLAACPQKLEGLLALSTPPFQILSAFAGRILGSPLATYANIQRLQGAELVRKQFIDAATSLNSTLSTSTPLDDSIQALSSIVTPFTGAEIAQCRAISATAIDSLQVFEQRLFALAKSSRLCGIYRIETKDVVPCKVCHIKSDRIIVDEQYVLVGGGDSQKYAIAINEAATRNYSKRGINISRTRKCEMLKRNIRILSDADFDQWIDRHILPLVNDINIRTQLMISDVFCERWLPKLIPGILEMTFLEAYRKKGQPEKISLRVVHRPDMDLSHVTSQIQELLDQVGSLGGIAPTSKSSVQ